jgi:hypothetical protein
MEVEFIESLIFLLVAQWAGKLKENECAINLNFFPITFFEISQGISVDIVI